MNNTSKSLLAVVLVAAFALSALPATAQTAAAFGSQIKLGDSDHIPVTGAASIAVGVNMLDFGVVGDVSDNCVILNTTGASDAVSNFDIRVTPCQGKAAGTLIGDADTVEKTAPGATALVAGTRVAYADVNNNGRYDFGDYVYLTTGTAPNLHASTSNTQFTVRLTAAGGFAAGTFVYAGNADIVSYGGAATNLTSSVAWFDHDLSASGAFTSGDNAYLVPVTAGLAAASLFSLNSVRLNSGNMAGAFGSQIALGNSDYIPVTGAISIPVGVQMLDFGVVGDVSDNCVILNTTGAPDGVSNFDIRLTPCQGKAAGTLIGDADTVEKTAPGATTNVTGTRVAYADVNNNGRYDSGDYVYLTTGTAPNLHASTSNTQFTVRLTAAGGFAAGTFVYAGNADIVSYGGAATTLTSSVAWFDHDLSASGAFTSGDNAYLVPAAATLASGSLFPLNSVRLNSGNVAGSFGTQTAVGHRDHIVVSSASAGVVIEAANSILRLNLGVANDINDDCIVANMDGGSAVTNFDIRLTPCQGKAAGTLISDADTVEKQASVVAGSANVRVFYADVNNNGRYDAGDYVYIVENSAAAPTTLLAPNAALTQYTVRLTPAGGKAAGTIVFAGDSDFVSYGSSVLNVNAGAFETFSWFDADLSSGTFTLGDSAYLSQGAGAVLGTGQLFPLNAVRLGGPAIVANPGSGSTTTTTTSAPTTTTTAAPTTTTTAPTTTAAPTTTTTGGASEPTKTPGFELVALIAALGAALVLVRRKL